MTRLGINILAQYTDHGEALEYTKSLKPRAVVVMDGYPLAVSIKQALPGSIVIHRKWNDNDAKWHEINHPAYLLVDSMMPGNVVHQLFNEPNGHTDLTLLVEYCVKAMEYADKRGVKLALPNFAVGHPDMARIDQMQPLFDAFARFPGHVYATHEYFQNDPAKEPYLIGRHLAIKARLPKGTPIVLTEYGRDIGGGPEDGWRHTGWSEDEYADRLIEGMKHIGGASVCIFGYGEGAHGRWRSFDISDAKQVKARISAWEEDEVSFNWGAKKRGIVKIKSAATSVNVRPLPGTSLEAFASLRNGDEVEYYNNTMLGGDYYWVKVEGSFGIGYVASEVVGFDPVPTVPPPEPVPTTPYNLTPDEMRAVGEAFSTIGRIYTTAAERAKAV